MTNNNPWIQKFKGTTDFKKIKSFVLEQEKEIIDGFNEKQRDSKFLIRTDVYPFCFSANLHSAKVILLMSNPGYDEKEEDNYRNPAFLKECIDILLAKCSSNEFKSDYWYKKLNPVKEELESKNLDGKKIIEDKIALVEYFPYHSIKYKPIGKRLLKKYNASEKYLPSQKWIFKNLKQRFSNNPIFICTRNFKAWKAAFEEMQFDFDKGHFYRTNSYLNPTISKKNFKNIDIWNLIIHNLKD